MTLVYLTHLCSVPGQKYQYMVGAGNPAATHWRIPLLSISRVRISGFAAIKKSDSHLLGEHRICTAICSSHQQPVCLIMHGITQVSKTSLCSRMFGSELVSCKNRTSVKILALTLNTWAGCQKNTLSPRVFDLMKDPKPAKLRA